jgi:hypothetical protein
MVDIPDILKRWDRTRTGIKKMPFVEAEKDMNALVDEVRRLSEKVKHMEHREKCKAQEYETMHIEIGNVIRKYT